MPVVVLGSDQAGQSLLYAVIEHLRRLEQYTVVVIPPHADKIYPEVAAALIAQLRTLKDGFGCLICGTGQGMAMAANRHSGIRAALCTHEMLATLAREHNDANVLCLGARIVAPELALRIVDSFLQTPFAGGRHAARVALLESFGEQKESA